MKKVILFATTIDQQLQFLEGIPCKLADLGWTVHVVCSPGDRLVGLADVRGVLVHPLPMRRAPSALHDLVALWAWIRIIRKVRPAVVVAGSPKASLLCLLAAWLGRVPRRVYMLHGLRLETSRGIRRRVLVCAERVAMLCSTQVFAVSESLRQMTVSLSLTSRDKVSVVSAGTPNGIDVAEFDENRFDALSVAELARDIGISPDIPVVGFVGRLTHDKGLGDLEIALRSLHDAALPVQLLLVGGIDDASGAEALERLRAIGMPVISTGHVEKTAVYYQLMDVFCLPSFREGFSTVVLEASCSGIPVVVSNATGVVDAVRDGMTGLVYGVGNGRQLAEKLSILINDAEIARSMADEGRAWVRGTFARDIIQAAFLREYEALLGVQ
ncbi:glycosyltransferase family 4 protein [Cryobacterium shii]|nr:glycosyltransferase family 4 protein [Cryobacterium shii]